MTKIYLIIIITWLASVKNYQWEMLDVPFVSQETVPNLDHSTECEDIQSDMSSIPDPEVGGLYSSNNFHQV